MKVAKENMTKRLTKAERQHFEFAERLYEILRKYQRGEYKTDSCYTVAGQLDGPLTAVYDDVRKATEALTEKKATVIT